MAGKRWRVGLVGVGRGFGYGKLLADEPRCEIVACCDRDPAALARFGEGLQLKESQLYESFDDFVGIGLDIVFVGTPIPAHAEQTVKALEAGSHVLSEVTMSNTLEGCQQIVDAVRRTGKRYMLAENCVYWHFVSQWREQVQSGKLGDIIHAECEYLHPIPHLVFDRATGTKRWRSYRPPLHYCSHSLGPILTILGDRITRACGLGKSRRILPEVEEDGGIDLQVALFETAQGVSIKLLRTSLVPRNPHLHYYSLYGTKGYLESDRRGTGGTGLRYIEGESPAAGEPMEVPLSDPSLPESARAGGHGTAEYSLVQAFLNALERGEKPPIDEVRGWDLTVPGLVAHESAMRDGQWMEVPAAE